MILKCQNCDKTLTGRQVRWCSDACLRAGAGLARLSKLGHPLCTRCGRPNRRGGKTRICVKCYRESPNLSVRLPGPPERKTCSFCLEEKPSSHFYKNAARPDWLSVYCRPCHSARAKVEYHSDADRMRDTRLWNRYNITLDEYLAIYESQGGRCAVCRREQGRTALVVDHSHSEPCIVRGLLCGRCNRFKVASLTIDDVDAVHQYLHHPPAVSVIGVRRVPLGMEKGEKRPRRRRRKKAASKPVAALAA